MLLLPWVNAEGQGVTTAAIRGTVRVEGRPVEAARVRVLHTQTGFVTSATGHRGSFVVEGLAPGGPYTIEVASLGFAPERRERLFLQLGEVLELVFDLRPLAAALDTVTVVATPSGALLAHGGTGSTIRGRTLSVLPTLNRDLYDFVRLVPQVSTRISLPNTAFSAAGVGFRFNNFLINGVSERTQSGGVSNAFAGLRSVPLDAVQEYQVLVSPYDVRYGDFAGAMVNTVTRSGTNSWTGSGFTYFRSDRLARGNPSAAATPYDRVQYGLSFGGPAVRDRLHVFAASEIQSLSWSAPGPYVGQPAGAERPVRVGEADAARLAAIMSGYGLIAGSAGSVENESLLRNLFVRIDAAVPAWRSRAVLWNNYSGGEERNLSRTTPNAFQLSSAQLRSVPLSRTAALQFHSDLPRAGGGHNELLVSRRSDRLTSAGVVQQPLVGVVVPATNGGSVMLAAGTPEIGQGGGFRSGSIVLKDNLSLPLHAMHVLTLGVESEWFHLRRPSVSGSYGTWTFASLDDFERGISDRFERAIDFGAARAPLRGVQYAAYVADRWTVSERLSLSAGLRADRLVIHGRPPYQPDVDSIFGRRTDRFPRERVELAPRAGFVWDVSGAQRHRLRGGAGIFTGRYPLAWAHVAMMRYGVAGGTLRCGGLPGDLGPPPAFVPDHEEAPSACANGSTLSANPRGDVNLLSPDLRMARALRGSLAFDTRLNNGTRVTAEAVVNRMLSDFVFVNLNLGDPTGLDRNGRVMYGSIVASGAAITEPRSAFSEVIDVANTSRNRSYQLAVSLAHDFGERSMGMASYTYSKVRDAQTPIRVNAAGRVTWGSARVVSGRHDDLTPGISDNDIPHRLVLAGSYRLPGVPRTELSFYWLGESGRPFTYIAAGVLRRGDLNADGVLNDPVYVPVSAFDDREIRFRSLSDSLGADTSAAAREQRVRMQQEGLEGLIARTECLRTQRGRILRRNSCREPWSNTTVASLRHSVPVAGRVLEAQLDVFNVLNLLNSRWGLRREAVPVLLEHVAQTVDSEGVAQPVFRFDAASPGRRTVSEDSAFQLQFALRYRF